MKIPIIKYISLKSFIEIFLTGDTGFIGKNVILFFNKYSFTIYSRNSKCIIREDIVINLAGKAHDLKKSYNPNDYYEVNTELSKKVFNAFLSSNAKVFITLSSIKAVADEAYEAITEDHIPNPITHYGKSKLLAEQYILSKEIPKGKRVYILRPCMIHGPGNRGNLNLLYNLFSKGIPWPLAVYQNQRSFCSIDNLMFIFKELIEREDIPSGVYNVADDIPLSTNDVISILGESQQRKPRIWNIPREFIELGAKFGNVFKLPFNEERLQKLTASYIVSNKKLLNAIGKPLPVSSREGLLKTFQSFQK